MEHTDMFTKHLTFEVIADLVEGRLVSDANGKANDHLMNCTDCTKQVNELRNTISLMRTDKMEDAPKNVLQNAINIMPRNVVFDKPSLFQKIVAAVSFDSSTFSPAYGVRSSGAATSRQLIFNAGSFDVDIRISKQADEWVITGQILGDYTNGKVELKNEYITVEASLNDLCEFKLPPVKEGNYIMRLLLSDAEIEFPEIVVK